MPSGRFRARPEVVSEAITEGLVLLDMDQGTTFRLNPTGKRVWELVGQGYNRDEIVATMSREFAGASGRVAADVDHFMVELLANRLIEPQPENAS
jgi:hypothetical protein